MFKPYLYFDGNATEAIELYKEAFGATVHLLLKNKDVNPDCGADGNLVNFAELAVNGTVIMMADLPGATPGRNFYVDIMGEPDYLQKIWAVLCRDAEIDLELGPDTFTELHGKLTDKYGINWMFTANH